MQDTTRKGKDSFTVILSLLLLKFFLYSKKKKREENRLKSLLQSKSHPKAPNDRPNNYMIAPLISLQQESSLNSTMKFSQTNKIAPHYL